MKYSALLIWFLVELIFVQGSRAQDPGRRKSTGSRIEGRIIDSENKRPLAFVNIVYREGGQGTVSNIDGEFSVPPAEDIDFLKFSYLGYHTRYIPREQISPSKDLLVKLEHKAYDIDEVRILPGVNPAHRIIKLVTENRDLNNPEKMRSFSYTSYSKMYFTIDMDSMYVDAPVHAGPSPVILGQDTRTLDSVAAASEGRADRPLPDSLDGGTASSDSTAANSKAAVSKAAKEPEDDGLKEMEDFFEKQHLFLMEFVSEREFMYPDRNHEVVTASRVSGFKDPSFTLLASQMQSFSFYNDLFLIWDRKYLNPISKGSTRKYLFIIEDTTYTENMDSLFIISYRPLRGKNFDGLEGILHINSNGYAVENVIAEAAETRGMFRIRIQQKYDYIEDKQWFPVQLNTDLMISPDNAKVNGKPMTLVGIGKTYLSDILLNPEVRKRDFNQIEITVEDDAHKKDEEFWNRYRVSPLTLKDTNTYEIIDSLGKDANLDRTLKVFETFATGYIPAGYFNIDYQSLLNFNYYEGFRFGIALETSNRVSRWFALGGKIAYGTKDRGLKYGGHARLNLNYRSDAFLKLTYNKDVTESAGWRFIEKPPITSSEVFRSFLIANMDIIEEKSAELQFPALRYMKINTYLTQGIRQVTTDYRFRVQNSEGIVEADRFNITEAGIKLKYAYKEKFLETPRGSRLSLGTDYPIIYANIHVGLPLLGGEWEYTRLEAKISKTFITKSLGDARIAISGGFADRELPYPLLFAGEGSYGKFTIETANSFATMRLNEFVSDHFVSLHWQQDFGKLLFKGERFQPGIELVANAGYGNLKFNSRHVNLRSGTMEKGYYESGILFNNLLRRWIIGYGLGTFYRFGPYSLPKTIDNFAFKFTIRFNL